MEKKSNKNSLSLKHNTATSLSAAAAALDGGKGAATKAPAAPITHASTTTTAIGHHQRTHRSSGKQRGSLTLQATTNPLQHHNHHSTTTTPNRHSVPPQASKSCSAANTNQYHRQTHSKSGRSKAPAAISSNISSCKNSNHNNSNAATWSTMVAAAPAGAMSANNSTTTDHHQAIVSAKAASVRNKNEEAVSDLLQRIPEIDNIFDVHSRIGNGTFSTVLLGTLKKERELPDSVRRKFAIKHHIPTSHPDRIMKELQCMAKMGGTDNVVGINCCIRYNESVAFIMPYMPHDRFHDFFNRMDMAEVQYYMRNLLVALKHVHKFNVIHRDVKPSNFLYNRRKRQFLLVDFGLAQQVPTPVNATPAAAVCATAGNGIDTAPTVNSSVLSVNSWSKNSAIGLTGTTTAAIPLEGKRSREADVGNANSSGKTAKVVSPAASASYTVTVAPKADDSGGIEASGVAKRLRCSGPHGDQQQAATPATNNTRTTAPAATAAATATTAVTTASIATATTTTANNANNNSNGAGVVGGGPMHFKVPLKQMNEIAKGGNGAAAIAAVAAVAAAATAAAAVNNNNNNNNSKSNAETPTTLLLREHRQAKGSTQSVAAFGIRLQQKLLRPQTGYGQSASSLAPLSMNSTVSAINAVASVTDKSTTVSGSGTTAATANAPKYQTNRQLGGSASANPKCFCYGNPQVCNLCLIKKEIHASRAGTPGYRPPEVLMKYPDQTTAVDVWAAGVIFLSILSSVYPFFKAPNDYVALAEMVTIFGDKTIRKTAFVLDRLVTLSQKTKPLDLRKLCVRFRNRNKFSSPDLLKKYQRQDGTCEVCKNCDQFYFNCLCADCVFKTEPLDADDPFPFAAYDLLCRLLEVNPHKRITADEALKHPFFGDGASGHGCNNNNNNNIVSTTTPTGAATKTPSADNSASMKRRD